MDSVPGTLRVSVVVPLYNKAKYILRCLESIRRQTFQDFEVIVVDDGSKDGSGDVAEQIGDPRFRVVRQSNRGEGGARNRGIAEGKGELVAFLDGDDAWEEGFLEAIVALADRFPSAGLFSTGYRLRLADGFDKEVTLRQELGQTVLIEDYLAVARQGDVLTSSSIAVRRSLFAVAGVSIEGPYGTDQEFWIRLSVYAPVAFDRRILAIYFGDASGRYTQAVRVNSNPPPAVANLRRLLREGAIPQNRRRETAYYTDWLLFKHMLSMLYGCTRPDILALIQKETFANLRFRIGAGFLRVGLVFLPTRVLAAFRLKPINWLRRARSVDPVDKLARAVEGWLGSIVLVRFVRVMPIADPSAPSR
jgi:glycosyltransferase involved in cell wall biosynthesis